MKFLRGHSPEVIEGLLRRQKKEYNLRVSLEELTQKVIEFRDKRDWKQFHKPKDMALSLVLEAVEVLELFQWKSDENIKDQIKKRELKKALGEELSDVLFWVLTMAHDTGIDLEKAFPAKLRKSGKRYPVRKAKGKATKYTHLK